jgi:glutamyl-tRNA reductase
MATDTTANLWAETRGILGIHAYVASLPDVGSGDLARLLLTFGGATFLERAVVVSTCSRLEFYAPAELPELDGAIGFRRLRGIGAVEHLAAVAAGAESIVAGETDVFAQVRGAFAPTSGALRQLGDIVIAAGRDARTRVTAAPRDAGRQLDLALLLAGRDLPGAVCIVGTGAMARHLAVRARELGAPRISVTGRHTRRAAALAADLGIEPVGGAVLPEAAQAACLLLAFKGVPAPPLRRSILEAARQASLVIDLTMPRFDWPEALAAGVVDLELLAARGDEPADDRSLRDQLRAAAVSAVRRRCQHALGDGPAIAVDLYRHIERIRVDEVQRARTHCEEDRDFADRTTKALVKKLFHAYGHALRMGDDPSLIQATRRLFLEAGSDT